MLLFLISLLLNFFFFFFFFFNDTATTEIYTLSLHDALPIWLHRRDAHRGDEAGIGVERGGARRSDPEDRKSTRLNSSHMSISYAVFCLKKKKITPAPFYLGTTRQPTSLS